VSLFTVSEIKRATGGVPEEKRTGRRSVGAVCIDSRKVERGCLFIALEGARTDGHEHLEEAVSKGCSVCLVARRWWSRHGARFSALARRSGAAIVVVSETLRALQDLAVFHLDRFPELVRVGITGSNGKTTTKEIVGSILRRVGPTAVSEGNLNSDIGLPLAAFRVNETHRFAVFEMGMNRRGEMDELVRVARPQAALITNVGTAHIEFLKTRDRIALEKKKIFRCFTGGERGFLYEGEPYFELLSEGVRGEIIPFGPKSTRGYRGSQDLGLDGMTIDWEGLQVRFPLFGHHNLLNALGAITLTSALGADRRAVKDGLEDTRPLFGRSEILRDDITLIHDSYNANPDSVRAVLDFFHKIPWNGNKLVVLGSMLELGEETREAHEQIVALALGLPFDGIFLFGNEMLEAVRASEPRDREVRCFGTDDFESLLLELRKSVRAGDLVLLKGSRSLRMERLVDPLTKSAA